jgi:serine kinase of HPr protein (carbohydrate metabolism regulator)
MQVKDILQSKHLTLLNQQGNLNNTVKGIFACDLLSHVMGFAYEDNVFITVLNNINVLGVASLIDLGCVVFSHNIEVNEAIIIKANELEIPLLSTKLTTAEITIELFRMGV